MLKCKYFYSKDISYKKKYQDVSHFNQMNRSEPGLTLKGSFRNVRGRRIYFRVSLNVLSSLYPSFS